MPEPIISMAGALAAIESGKSGNAALRYGAAVYSYADIQRLARTLGATTASLMGEGSRGALAIPNHPCFVIAALALAMTGCSIVLVDPEATAHDLDRVAAECGVSFFLCLAEQENVERWASDADWLSSTITFASEADIDVGALSIFHSRQASARTSLDEREMQQAGIFKSTSGSSGRSKVVFRSYEQVMGEVNAVTARLGYGEQDVVFCMAPLFHSYGFIVGFLTTWSVGATLVLSGKHHPRTAAIAIADHAVSVAVGVPLHYKFLADCPLPASYRAPNLRMALSAGAPMPEGVRERFAAKFGIAPSSLYGATETGVISVGAPTDAEGCVGRALENTVVSIRTEVGEALVDGEVGEICVASPTNASGYVNNPELASQKFSGGWFRTGDTGWRASDGSITITGRLSTIINVGGNKIDPEEIEAQLLNHPGIRSVVLVGEQTDGGDRLKAFIVPEGSLTHSDVRRFCRESIKRITTPDIIEFVESIPTSASGKVLRGKLYG